MRLDLVKDGNRYYGETQADQQALGVIGGKTSLTEEEYERALIILTGATVTIREEEPKP